MELMIILFRKKLHRKLVYRNVLIQAQLQPLEVLNG